MKMRQKIVLGILLTLAWVSSAQRRKVWSDTLPSEKLEGVPQIILKNEKNYLLFKNMLMSMFGPTSNNKMMQRALKQEKAQKYINDSIPFFCDVTKGRSKQRPTSVHALRPGDIDVIAAIGDSITAGMGIFAQNIPQLLIENRGVGFIIGGQENWRKFLTLPNILKEFNPKLVGYADSDAFTHNRGSNFNVAEPGTMIQDLPFMTRELVKRIKKDPRVDFKNDWKLVNLFIGANNICIDFCYVKNLTETFEEQKRVLTYVFTYLRDNMPRTMVNFMHTPNLETFFGCSSNSSIPPVCNLLRLYACPCLFALQFQPRRLDFFRTIKNWHLVDEELAQDEQFRTKDDFAIVLQTFTKEISTPFKRASAGKLVCDLTYQTQDCFHLSQKGSAKATNALWNNMLEPVGHKSTNWPIEFEKILCPTEQSPYIYTWKNSGL